MGFLCFGIYGGRDCSYCWKVSCLPYHGGIAFSTLAFFLDIMLYILLNIEYYCIGVEISCLWFAFKVS